MKSRRTTPTSARVSTVATSVSSPSPYGPMQHSGEKEPDQRGLLEAVEHVRRCQGRKEDEHERAEEIGRVHGHKISAACPAKLV